MAPTLYMVYASPPARAVLMTAKAIDLTLNIKQLNLIKGDQLKSEYLKLNPQHTVPTLVDDDGYTVWDSHAIMIYLVRKYGKNDALYPQDIKKQAIIHQRLHFESGVVFPCIRNISRPTIEGTKTLITNKDKEPILETYQFLEDFLEGKNWMAGDYVSIADYSLITSVTSLNTFVTIDDKFPKLAAWVKRVESLPEYEENKKGLSMFQRFFKSRL